MRSSKRALNGSHRLGWGEGAVVGSLKCWQKPLKKPAPWQGDLQETTGAFQVKVRKARGGRWLGTPRGAAVRITEWLWKSLDMTGEGVNTSQDLIAGKIQEANKESLRHEVSTKDILFPDIKAILIPNSIKMKGQPDRVGTPVKKGVKMNSE